MSVRGEPKSCLRGLSDIDDLPNPPGLIHKRALPNVWIRQGVQHY